jgi:hypothetical protein
VIEWHWRFLIDEDTFLNSEKFRTVHFKDKYYVFSLNKIYFSIDSILNGLDNEQRYREIADKQVISLKNVLIVKVTLLKVNIHTYKLI